MEEPTSFEREGLPADRKVQDPVPTGTTTSTRSNLETEEVIEDDAFSGDLSSLEDSDGDELREERGEGALQEEEEFEEESDEEDETEEQERERMAVVYEVQSTVIDGLMRALESKK